MSCSVQLKIRCQFRWSRLYFPIPHIHSLFLKFVINGWRILVQIFNILMTMICKCRPISWEQSFQNWEDMFSQLYDLRQKGKSELFMVLSRVPFCLDSQRQYFSCTIRSQTLPKFCEGTFMLKHLGARLTVVKLPKITVCKKYPAALKLS